MQLLRQEYPALEACDMTAKSGSDPIRLLRRVAREYEPLLITQWLKNKAGKG